MLTLASACLLVDREAKFKRLLKEALESGMLAAKVGILKHPGKAGSMSESGSALSSPMCRSLLRHRGKPPHEMEIMKAHLREVRLVRYDALCMHCPWHGTVHIYIVYIRHIYILAA